MKNLPVKRAVSSGGIVFKKEDGECSVVLVGVERKGKLVWALPKGLVEKGERPEETAIREVREEAGVEGELVDKIGDISYWYVDKEEGVRYHKTVHFYLLKYLNGSPENHDWEIKEARWFPINDAINVLEYPTEKKMLLKAKEMISKLCG
ncbi:NUDIX hydrolase [bacterium]|nr:NUDIX hydrolase [bacterium]